MESYQAWFVHQNLALYHACVWGDYALNSALGMELQRGTMLTSYESVVIELTGRQSGRCVEFTMPGPGREGLWWCEEDDVLRQRPG
jgi:hypothetical protein